MLLGLLGNPVLFISFIIALLVAITIHEFSHAWMANYLGDPTAKLAGRLSLNPLAHLDPMGTLMLLLVGFGWGKPVPFNPYFLRRGGKAAPLLIALAGPTSNFLLAFALSLIYRLIFPFVGNTAFISGLYIIIEINIILMVFNLLPIPPLDGSKILYVIPGISEESIMNFERIGIFILFGLIFLSFIGGLNIFSRVIFPIINFILVTIFRLPPISN
jgi:Zn-dependent protease